MNPTRVGVLSFHNSKETKAILNAVDALGHTPVWLRRHNVASRIRQGVVETTPEVDVVVNRLLVTKSDRPLRDLSMARVLAAEFPTVNRPSAVETAVHKYRAAVRLADEDVPVPDTGLPFGRGMPTEWDGDWRSNVALGGEVVDVTAELPNAIRRHAVRATDVLGLDCAGVDVVRGPDGPVVTEVNPTAGFKGLFEATDTSPAPSIAAAALERVGRTVPRSEVTAIADAFDDSVPECKPPRPASDGGRSVLGYTTDVTVGGGTGKTTTSGKVDTGADRTTIGIDVASEIGAGPIVDVAEVKIGTSSKRRPLADVDVRIDGDRWRELEVGIADRSTKRHPVLLGRDVLDDFRIDPRHAGERTSAVSHEE